MFVLIQILCDQNFKLKKNIENEPSNESNKKITPIDIDHKPKIKIEPNNGFTPNIIDHKTKIKIEKDTIIDKQQQKKSKSCDQSCCPDHDPKKKKNNEKQN